MSGDSYSKSGRESLTVQSRLSPSAPPFILNNQEPSFNPFLLADDCISEAVYGCYEDTSLTIPYDYSFENESNSYHFQYPSKSEEGFLLHDHANSLGLVDAGASMAYNSFVKQGKVAAEGLKPFGETSHSLHGKGNGMARINNQMSSKDTEQANAECLAFPLDNYAAKPFDISVSSDWFSVARPKDSQSQLSPVMTYSDPNVALRKGHLSHLYPRANELTISHSSEYNSSPARIVRPSGGNANLSFHKPITSKSVDFCGVAAATKKENYSGFKPCSVMEGHVRLNAKDKVVCHENIPIDKGKGEKNVEPVINVAVDPLVMENTELLISFPSVVDDFTLRSNCAASAISNQNSSEVIDQSDSDIDSPCWKGTGAHQSTFRVPGPMSSQLPKIEIEAQKSLNPLAPHFFPGNSNQVVENQEIEFDGNNPLCFQKTASSVALSPKDHILTDSLKAGMCHPSEDSNAIGAQCSNDNNYAWNDYAPLPNKSNRSFVLDSSLGDQPCLMEHHLTSNGQRGARVNAGSVKGIKDAIHYGSTSVSSTMTGNVLTSPCSGSGVSSEIDEAFQSASKTTPTNIDVGLLIKAMHVLSELLACNYSNDLDSIKEHEHEMIWQIINNLSVCITHEVGPRVSIPGSSHPSTSYIPRKLSDRQKEFLATSMKAMTNPHDEERQKYMSAMFSKKVPGSSARSNEGIKKGDDVTQRLIGKGFKENYQIKEGLHPQALHENLLLRSEAAPCL